MDLNQFPAYFREYKRAARERLIRMGMRGGHLKLVVCVYVSAFRTIIGLLSGCGPIVAEYRRSQIFDCRTDRFEQSDLVRCSTSRMP